MRGGADRRNKREKEIAGANGGESVNTVTVTGNNWGTGRHSDIKAVLTSAAAQIGISRRLPLSTAIVRSPRLTSSTRRATNLETRVPVSSRVCTIRPVRPLRA